MDSYTEKFISNFIESQFPQFYQEEGETFILFVKAYYEWMESSGDISGDAHGGPIRESRELLEYRDIDTTVEKFLEYFQKKYLYGIPFNVIVNKRFLLKHIIDVYSSKGTIQCYKLLFKMIYNEDVEVYLPGRDVLRVSDGIWIEPRYLEVSLTTNLLDLIGKNIIGSASKTTALVEYINTEYVNNDAIQKVYISNISPKGGEFVVGERIIDQRYISNTEIASASPLILGSLDSLDVFNSGVDFQVGDILKVARRDPGTGEQMAFGVDAYVMVKSLFRGYGSLNFTILNGGFGFMANASVFIYKNVLDTTGRGADFNIKLADTQNLVYNTDPLVGYLDLTLDATAYGFPSNTSANLSSTLSDALAFSNGLFGRIATLTNVQAGNGYIAPANVFVRSTITSINIPGRVTYFRADDILSAFTSTIYANTTSVNNTSHALLIANANTNYDVNDLVLYRVPTGNVAITNLNPNTFYYVKTTNTTSVTLSKTLGGNVIQISANTNASAETHYLLNDIVYPTTPSVNGYSVNVYANTTSVNNATYDIKSASANTYLKADDWIYYEVPSGNTPIVGLTGNNIYYIYASNSSAFSLTTEPGGSQILITEPITTAGETHTFKTTRFKKYFANDDIVYLTANNSNTDTTELAVIRQVVDDTKIVLYGYPNNTCTDSSVYGVAPVIMPAQFAITETVMKRLDKTINGINDRILALNSSGNNIVETVRAINSGKAYVEGETVHAYRYGILNVPTIANSGIGYANGDTLIFSGGLTSSPARGSILTNSLGHITSINTTAGAWYAGSGYNSVPSVTVRSTNSLAYGAVLSTSIIEYDTASEIRGIVRKTGIGRGFGYWGVNDSELNSDKRIQDSYYYQDYSYELKSSLALDKYKDILYTTFHPSGAEMFGKFELQPSVLQSPITLVESGPASFYNYTTSDSTYVTVDSVNILVSDYIYANTWLTVDSTTINTSNATLTVDRIGS
jgi:hypothetical protein